MRVLVADDHSLFRDGIISLLEADDFEIVGQVGDGKSAIEEVGRLLPDLVLMDITMPIMNGLEALKLINAKYPQVQVVMLTVSDEDADLLEAIKSGASGYLLKSHSANDFLASLRSLNKDEMALTHQTSTRLIKNLVGTLTQSSSPIERLTNRETEILLMIAQGLPNKSIAHKLALSENTVKYHIKKIMRKYNVRNRTEAVAYAVRVGLFELPTP